MTKPNETTLQTEQRLRHDLTFCTDPQKYDQLKTEYDHAKAALDAELAQTAKAEREATEKAETIEKAKRLSQERDRYNAAIKNIAECDKAQTELESKMLAALESAYDLAVACHDNSLTGFHAARTANEAGKVIGEVDLPIPGQGPKLLGYLIEPNQRECLTRLFSRYILAREAIEGKLAQGLTPKHSTPGGWMYEGNIFDYV